MKVLVTGGAGYIGSVTVEALIKKKFQVVVFDSLIHGHREAIPEGATFIKGDIRNPVELEHVFLNFNIDAVLHFAGLIAVGESVHEPQRYYDVNVSGSLCLLERMIAHKVKKIVFSSTAAVYGDAKSSPLLESSHLNPTNPYGETKLAFERILKWYSQAYNIKYASLRYFNASGASANLGEDHHPETHLIPMVLQAALGMREHVTVFGDDYSTADGTCIRDFIHVEDLALAHLMALEHLDQHSESYVFNLGSGQGASVKEVIEVAKKVTGRNIVVQYGSRRSGDSSTLVASNKLITETLGWKPKKSSLERILKDAYAWRLKHPHGYTESKAKAALAGQK